MPPLPSSPSSVTIVLLNSPPPVHECIMPVANGPGGILVASNSSDNTGSRYDYTRHPGIGDTVLIPKRRENGNFAELLGTIKAEHSWSFDPY